MFGQSYLNNEYVIGLRVEVPTGVFGSGQAEFAGGLSSENHIQKQNPGFGFQMGAIFHHERSIFSSRYLLGYATHSGTHEVSLVTGETLFSFSTKYQALSASAELLVPVGGRRSGISFFGGLGYDMETLDIERGKKENYTGGRFSLSLGLMKVFYSKDITWSAEVGLRGTVAGTFDVNGGDFPKRNTLYVATSVHF